MANESTYALISSLLNVVWESALWYMQHSFVMPRYITVFTDMQGMVDRKVSEYIETAVTDNLGETTDLTPVEFARALLSTLTPKEIGKQFVITDRRIESDTENVLADAARDLGYSIGKKVEQDLLALIGSLTGGVIGARASAFDLNYIWQARAILETAAVPGPYTVVIHPYHWLDVQAELVKLSNAAPLDIRNQAQSNYYVSRIADMDLVVSTLLPLVNRTTEVQTVTVDATGGTFTLSYNGETTAAIAENAAASAVETALEALGTLSTTDVAVTGSAGGPFTVTFAASLGNVSTLIADGTALTGGTGVTVANTTQGSQYAKAGVFTRDALALDVRRGLRIEPERDASLRSTELNATMIYAKGVWRPTHGIIIEADASAPNA